MSTDNRRGHTFSIRLTDEEQERLTAAAQLSRPVYRYGTEPVGPWIVKVALAEADRRLAEKAGASSRVTPVSRPQVTPDTTPAAKFDACTCGASTASVREVFKGNGTRTEGFIVGGGRILHGPGCSLFVDASKPRRRRTAR